MYNTRANKTVPGLPQCSPTFRCDHCRRLLSRRVDNYWYDMRFCSAACVAAYQRRLHEETVTKIRRLDPGNRESEVSHHLELSCPAAISRGPFGKSPSRLQAG